MSFRRLFKYPIYCFVGWFDCVEALLVVVELVLGWSRSRVLGSGTVLGKRRNVCMILDPKVC
jgi:hypothetical protein